MPVPSPAVFLDKDGTIIEDLPYNVDPDRLRLAPGAGEGLRLLCEAGYRLVVVSNQSGVARGFFPEAALEAVRDRLSALLAELGAPLAGFYCCPHHPEGVLPGYAIACQCRKPRPGLVHSACRDLGIDPRRSWLVGDKLDDVEAGRRAGCRTVLLGPDGSTPSEETDDAGPPPWRRPHYRARDLAGAARLILSADGSTTPPGRPAPAADRRRSR